MFRGPGELTIIAVILLLLVITVSLFLREIVRRRSAQRNTESLLQLESAISELLALCVKSSADELDHAIDQIMSRLSPLLHVDRVSVLEFSADKTELWVTRSTMNGSGLPVRLNSDDVAWYSSKLLNSEEVVITDVDQLPEGTGALKKLMKDRGVEWNFSVPLEASGSVLGALAFSCSRKGRELPHSIVHQCRLLGRVVAGALLRKRADQAFARSEQIKNSILACLAIYVAVLDAEGHVVEFRGAIPSNGSNVPPCSLEIGCSYLKALERALGDTKEALAATAGIRAVCERKQGFFEVDYSHERDGTRYWFAMTVTTLPGATRRALVVHRDISKERWAEEAVRDISGRLIGAHEEERSRIARELHDSISQQLAVLAINLNRIQGVGPESLRPDWQRLRRMITSVSHDVHRLSHNLHSAKLDHLGLAAALRALCEDTSRECGLDIKLRTQGAPCLSRSVSLNLYRVAQEALHNMVKHSGATEGYVELSESAGELLLQISDNGGGFKIDSVTIRDGLGLSSMRERLHSIGGVLTVSSELSRGTRIEARVPLRSQSSGAEYSAQSAT